MQCGNICASVSVLVFVCVRLQSTSREALEKCNWHTFAWIKLSLRAMLKPTLFPFRSFSFRFFAAAAAVASHLARRLCLYL